MRRITTVAALVAVLGLAGAGTANAAPTGPAPAVGPECNPGLVAAVLAAVGGIVVPGTTIQYIEVRQDPETGVYTLAPCVVTVPG